MLQDQRMLSVRMAGHSDSVTSSPISWVNSTWQALKELKTFSQITFHLVTVVYLGEHRPRLTLHFKGSDED